jgi:hypothetical protein
VSGPNGGYSSENHLWEGKYIKSYEMFVCDTCYDFNEDGWNPRYDSKIIEHLEENDIDEPERNENGWLPREF